MQTKIKRKAKGKRGGLRPNSGRPPKVDKDQWVEANVRLRRDTVERLRVGAGSKLFGKFLQEHLDRHPPPTREQYLRLGTRRMRVPLSPEEQETRKAERERKEWEQTSPGERLLLTLLANPKKMDTDPVWVARVKLKYTKEELRHLSKNANPSYVAQLQDKLSRFEAQLVQALANKTKKRDKPRKAVSG